MNRETGEYQNPTGRQTESAQALVACASGVDNLCPGCGRSGFPGVEVEIRSSRTDRHPVQFFACRRATIHKYRATSFGNFSGWGPDRVCCEFAPVSATNG